MKPRARPTSRPLGLPSQAPRERRPTAVELVPGESSRHTPCRRPNGGGTRDPILAEGDPRYTHLGRGHPSRIGWVASPTQSTTRWVFCLPHTPAALTEAVERAITANAEQARCVARMPAA